MSDATALIATVRGYLPDKDMPFHDDMDPYEDSWEKKDRPFGQIQPVMVSAWDSEAEHLIQEFTPISSQGDAGTCVANAWCDAVEILVGLEYGSSAVVQLSRRFAYWISRYLHSATNEEKGTFLRAMGHQFRKVGVILEEVMPYSDEYDMLVGKKASPKLEHFTMASNNRIKGFYRLGSDEEQMLREAEIAVRSNHPVIFGVPVGLAFSRTRSLQVFGPPDDTVGNHCMIVAGVGVVNSMRQWFVRNSWGTNWGENGHCWITDAYLAMSRDTWVGTMLEPLI
jgi:hypothetical protein